MPPGFTQLADPYDPTENALYRFAPYGMHDMSYYKGRLYIYFGVTPALILFWPYLVLTGHYLSYGQAGAIFCAIGFLASVGLLRALWRRYFAEVGVAVVVTGTLALGLVIFTPYLLARCDVYEVAISCGYALTMLALVAIWKALHNPSQRGRWLAAASLAYGLAVGARPSLLFGAAVLLVPVAQAWRERRKVWAPLLAAISPIVLIGLGLMLYNLLRFGSPFEFGFRYQLGGNRQSTQQFFSLRYLWFNFRVCSLGLALVRLGRLQEATGHYEQALQLKPDYAEAHDNLGTALLQAGKVTEAIGHYEQALQIKPDYAEAHNNLGLALVQLGRLQEAMEHWEQALRIKPDYAEAHYNLGVALEKLGRTPEAIQHYERALRIKPNFVQAQNNLARARAVQ